MATDTTETDFNEEQRKRIDAAYMAWQSEESRDRGYDFALCQKLRDRYRTVLADATEENERIATEMNGGCDA